MGWITAALLSRALVGMQTEPRRMNSNHTGSGTECPPYLSECLPSTIALTVFDLFSNFERMPDWTSQNGLQTGRKLVANDCRSYPIPILSNSISKTRSERNSPGAWSAVDFHHNVHAPED
jgi:hypothetical protein